MKLIESCALGLTSNVPVYYVDQDEIVQNLSDEQCNQLYQYMLQDNRYITKDLVDLSDTLFTCKWLVEHLQPFQVQDQTPILNCIFSSKLVHYMNK